jgi:hypothetical protein
MKPIQDETSLLKNAHSNITRCVASMGKVLAHFRTVSPPPRLPPPGAR